MTPKEQFERFQGILGQALAKMDALRLPNELDESFDDAFREALVGAGATDSEVKGVAAFYVTIIFERTADSELRREQCELIARHLASTDMTLKIGRDDSWRSVEFPSRPKRH